MYQKLQNFLGVKNGRPKRGAVSRLAEAMGVCHTTVRRWLEIGGPDSCRRRAQIDAIIARGLDTNPVRPGPVPKIDRGSVLLLKIGGKSNAEIAAAMGCSRERVRQIVASVAR